MFTFPSLEVEDGSHLIYHTSPEVKVPSLEATALLLTSLLPWANYLTLGKLLVTLGKLLLCFFIHKWG